MASSLVARDVGVGVARARSRAGTTSSSSSSSRAGVGRGRRVDARAAVTTTSTSSSSSFKSSSRSAAMERRARDVLGTQPLGKRALGGDDAFRWLATAIEVVAEACVEEALEGRLKSDAYDLTREITRATSGGGKPPTEAAGAARAHRATTNPLFLRAAFKAMERAYDGDVEAAKSSEAWAHVRVCVTTASKVMKTKAATTSEESEAPAEARRREARERIGAFVARGKELLALERARELEDTTVGALVTDDADDAEVVDPVVAAGGDAAGLRLVGATRSTDGKTLLVLRSSVEDDIAMGALRVGDRVKISTYAVPDDASVDGSVDIESVFSREASVRFLGDALNKKAADRYADASSITLEYDEDEQTLVRALSGREVWLSRALDETTYERQVKAMDILESIPAVKRSKPACLAIVKTVFNEDRQACWRNDDEFDSGDGVNFKIVREKALRPIGSSLLTKKSFDESQTLALCAAASPHFPVVCIKGPPGTGKTSVVLEIIAQAVARGERVLACAPSNLAVDNLVERLDGVANVRALRFGAPERISPAALSSSLDVKVAEATEAFFAKQRVESSETSTELRAAIERYAKAQMVPQKVKQQLQNRITALKAKLKASVQAGTKHRKASEAKILREANVLLATNAGAGIEAIQTLPPFDLVIIDEAAQASEPLSWIPMVRGKRVVLIGDPCQLAPVIRSQEAVEAGLARSLMSRLMPRNDELPESSNKGNRATAYASSGVLALTLSVQYRSHQAISSWSSAEAYGGKVQAHKSVKTSLLCDLRGVQKTPITALPMLMITTRTDVGRIPVDCHERRIGGSYMNEGEAMTAAAHVLDLLKAGVKPSDIAVISPYAAQVRLLRNVFAAALTNVQDAEQIEISSIDAFQGREAECVVISTVRSNSRRFVGFLSDRRRMNVAITRAKKHVTIIGDDVTIRSDPFLERLVEHVQKKGAVISRADVFKHSSIDRD